jgi:surfeit locus 1 family protein
MEKSVGLVVPPRVRALAGFVAVVALLLCGWQLRRHGERNAGREAALLVAGTPTVGDGDPSDAALAWHVVRWSGRWEGLPHLVSGRQEKSARGYGVAQVFVRDDGRRVLVDRGWVPVEGVGTRVTDLAGQGAGVLTGQLRPAFGSGSVDPIEGHGTRIWPGKAWPSIQAATGTVGPLFAVAGGEDGARSGTAAPLDGFDRVPARDDTSLHYAAQWLAIAGIGAVILSPAALRRARQILGA